MPKSELARKGRVAVPEEELSSDEEGLAVYPSASNINTASLVMAAHAQKDTKRKMLSHGTGEWERVSVSLLPWTDKRLLSGVLAPHEKSACLHRVNFCFSVPIETSSEMHP